MEAGGQHSVFAKALLDVLRMYVENSEVLDGHSLFDEVRKRVLARTDDQLPLYTQIPGTGHEGGDFLFVPRD